MSLYNLKQVDQSNPVLIGSTALHRLNDGQPKPNQPMTRERSFKHFYPIPHDGGFIEPIIHIEYEAHDWGNEHAGSIDVLDATLGHFKFVKDNDRFDFIKAVMTDTEREVAQAWLDQTPLDFFHDAAFENECEEWQEPTLSLQP